MFYTVGEAAKMLGIAPSALRYYDKEGLLPFVERSEGGIRMFKDSDMEWLKLIECLKATGMPIKTIKTFVDWALAGDETIDDRLGLLRQQKQSVLKKIDELKTHLERIDYKIWYYSVAKEEGTCMAADAIPAGDVPENLRKFRNGGGENIANI
ncbi:MAG: MerR family transcriptional regulator [Clostridia bacterium]|nr:MerR family transcriptional regulator [Clostridia bacterium]